MIIERLDLALAGGVEARILFTGRGAVPDPVTGPGGSGSAGPGDPGAYGWANLGSHVGDDPGAVVSARTRLAGELGVPAGSMTFMHPDHGRGVAVVTSPTGVAPGAELRDVDALVTGIPGVGLVALAADCVPIVLVEPQAAIVAAVHSGWKGVQVDVSGAAVDRIVELGGRPDRLQAWLGPAICGSCYAVPAQRVAEVAAVCPEAVSEASDGQPALDLRAGVAASLGRHGVTQVSLVGACTAEDPGLYSHRRDQRTGRHGAAVAMRASDRKVAA